MQKSYRFILSVVMLGAFLLSACTGVTPQQDDSTDVPSSSNSQSNDVVFTGTVESMDGTYWLISGQSISVDDLTQVDANLQVGDTVKVEATVSQNGDVLALTIESPGADDAVANDNSNNENDANTNDDNANSNDNTNTASDNSNDAAGAAGQEVYGVVDAVTDGEITIDGVTYNLADFTEFKDIISVGDQVKIHVIVNADGTFTILEIENSNGIGANNNSNSNDDQSISNSNGNSNDDSHDDNNNSNGNSNDDDEHDDD
jgi:hypothetical protein